jgi:hypothetical protein
MNTQRLNNELRMNLPAACSLRVYSVVRRGEEVIAPITRKEGNL